MKFSLYFVFAYLFLAHIAASAQTGSSSAFQTVQEAFDAGQYERVITDLVAYQKVYGTSPRLESLRALAYNELGNTVEAYKTVQVYFRLTGGRDLISNEAHQNLVELRNELAERIDKDFAEKRKKLDEERDREAEREIAEVQSLYESRESRLAGTINAGRPAGSSNLDALAELEVWRKINQSSVAMDYFLFIESFPSGQFTEIARKKMLKIGDPIWNAVRDTYDPFKVREFVRANPDSPFLEHAKARMKDLAEAAIEWETLKDSKDQYMLKGFEVRNPGHPLAAEAKKIRADIVWKQIENSNSAAKYEEFMVEFPESRHSSAARSASTPSTGAPQGEAPLTAGSAFAPSGDPAADINRMFDAFQASKSFRTRTVIVIPGQAPVSTQLEFVAPDRYRVVNANGPNTVIIGKDYFTESGGRWQKMPANAGVPAMPDMRSSWDKKGREGLSDAKYLGEETVKGRPTHVYTALSKGVDGVGANDSKYWIANSNGLPVRLEAVYKTGPLKSLTIEYEYDPNITIEPPLNQSELLSTAKPQIAISLLHLHTGTFSIKAVPAKLEFDGTKLSVTEMSDGADPESKHTYSLGCTEIKILINHFDYILIGPKRSAKAYAPSLTGNQQKPEMVAFVEKVRAACNLKAN